MLDPLIVPIQCSAPHAPWYHLPVGIFAVLAGLGAAIMSLREKPAWKWKAPWLLAIFLFTAGELQMIVWSDADAAEKRDYAACQLEKNFQTIETESQRQFAITAGRLGKVITAQTIALATENKMLMQTMGGAAYPKFYVLPPISHNDDLWPVQILTPGTPWPHGHVPTPAEKAPLIDVTVDISEILKPDPKTMTVSPDAFESQFFPQHYSLGTITVPEMRTAPFKLRVGRDYQLLITTRRRVFSERVYFLRDEKAIGGWKVSECVVEKYTLYGRDSVIGGERLIDGRCEN